MRLFHGSTVTVFSSSAVVDNKLQLWEGILTKHDYTILFEGNDGKKYIPVETTDSLYIYSNVIFSQHFFDFMNATGLNVCMINKYGEKIGGFVPQNNRRNIKM